MECIGFRYPCSGRANYWCGLYEETQISPDCFSWLQNRDPAQQGWVHQSCCRCFCKLCLKVQILLHRCMREEWEHATAAAVQTPRPVKKEQEEVLQAVTQRCADLLSPLHMSLSLTILLYFFEGNKLKQFSPCQICFDDDGKWWVVFFVLLSAYKNIHLFFSPS